MLIIKTKKASKLYLSKEASTKDQNLKTQMMMTLNDDNDSQKTETIWRSNGFFKEQRTDFTINKPNFPENILVYVNQGSISHIKGEQAIYVELVILGQILPFANPDPKIKLDNHDFKDNEVLLFVLSYKTETGLCQGLKKKLGCITLRENVNEQFFSYGYNKKNSKVLFCTVKQPLPNIFHCTAFKKHMSYLLDENQKKSNMSHMFLFLPSILESKNPNWFWKFLPDLVKLKVFDYLNTLHDSKYFRKYILDKIINIFYLASGFCSLKNWENIC